MILYTFCRQITLYCIVLTNCGNKCFQCFQLEAHVCIPQTIQDKRTPNAQTPRTVQLLWKLVCNWRLRKKSYLLQFGWHLPIFIKQGKESTAFIPLLLHTFSHSLITLKTHQYIVTPPLSSRGITLPSWHSSVPSLLFPHCHLSSAGTPSLRSRLEY